MPINTSQNAQKPLPIEPWTIVGGGPVGSMLALMLATIFPQQPIYIFDKLRPNQREHGLLVWDETIEKALQMLKQLQNSVQKNLDPTSSQAQEIMKNIEAAQQFLLREFPKNYTGTFIRTNVLSQKLREFASLIGNVSLKLAHEVTADHLQQLQTTTDPKHEQSEPKSSTTNDESKDEIQAILQLSNVIFAADGARSLVRKSKFSETDANLKTENLAYVIEIKLQLNSNSNTFKDQLYKSVLPTLTKGNLHIWQSSKDNAATLRIFVDEAVYKKLRSKEKEGQTLGTFPNPYHYLIDLPGELKQVLSDTIDHIIGLDNFNPASIKITTLPLGVYVADRLVTTENDRLFALIGDAAAGLILATGVNNGLMGAVEHAAAMWYHKLRSAQQPSMVFEHHEDFKQDHLQQKLPGFLTFLRGLDPAVNVTEKVDYITKAFLFAFNQITEDPTNNTRTHQSNVANIMMKFTMIVAAQLQVEPTLLEEPVKQLFAELSQSNIVGQHAKSEFHIAEENIHALTAQNIKKIHGQIDTINFYNDIVGPQLSPYKIRKHKDKQPREEAHNDEVFTSLIELKNDLRQLKLFIKKHPQIEENLTVKGRFVLDQVYIALKNILAHMEQNTKGSVLFYYRDSIKLLSDFLHVMNQTSLADEDKKSLIVQFSRDIGDLKLPHDYVPPDAYLAKLKQFTDVCLEQLKVHTLEQSQKHT